MESTEICTCYWCKEDIGMAPDNAVAIAKTQICDRTISWLTYHAISLMPMVDKTMRNEWQKGAK